MSALVSRKALLGWPALGQWAATPLAWSLLATAFLVIATLAGPGPSLSDWLGDTDDAVRLVSVRELLAGAPWFDTTLPRIGAPEPLVSHWSRLIDLPLAALIGTLTPLLGPERAELATRAAWPALIFFGLALIVAREAYRRAGAGCRRLRTDARCHLRRGAGAVQARAHRPPQRANPVRRRGAALPPSQPGR